MTISIKIGQTDRRTDGQTDGQTDKLFENYYFWIIIFG
jgi:hypothetical protein